MASPSPATKLVPVVPLGGLFSAAALGGLAAGLVVSFAFLLPGSVVSLILDAEKFERRLEEQDSTPWAPEDGFERTMLTVVGCVLLGFGFGMVLVAALALRGPATPLQGALYGVAGFVATYGSQSLGLPPELPGMAVVDLDARQGWWLGTLAASLLALALGAGPVTLLGSAVEEVDDRARWLLALLLLLVPHFAGPPQAGAHDPLPAELVHPVADYVTRVPVCLAVFWLVLGVACADLHGRLCRHHTEDVAKSGYSSHAEDLDAPSPARGAYGAGESVGRGEHGAGESVGQAPAPAPMPMSPPTPALQTLPPREFDASRSVVLSGPTTEL